MKLKSLLALAALPVAVLTTGCVPGQFVGGGSSAPATSNVVVARIVDGDTVKLTSGEVVRFIGIDTPERGQCGFDQANALMKSMVVGQTVALTAVPGRDDRDHYGRLLRYVETATSDVGRVMIESGWAHHRYDGTDGYEAHPRQEDYIALDAAANAPACGW